MRVKRVRHYECAQWTVSVSLLSEILLYFVLICIISTKDVYANRPPKFIIDGQTEIVLRLKEGSDTPAGK